jgi:hypothetical protein
LGLTVIAAQESEFHFIVVQLWNLGRTTQQKGNGCGSLVSSGEDPDSQ